MPSLQHLAPSQLITLLEQFNTANNHAIYPIWLNNEGQNVIGLLPKTIFEIHSQNQLTQKQRQNCSFDDLGYCDTVINTGADTAINRVGKGVDIGELTAVLEAYQHQQLSSKQSAIQHTANVGYQDGLMGFISYDLSAHHLANANHVQANATHGEASYLTPHQPQLFLGHYDIYLTFENNHWQLHATTQEAIEQIDVIQHWLMQTLTVENKPVVNPIMLQPIWQTSDYEHAFYKVQDYLTAGDCYQINLTQCWQGELSNQQLVDYLPSLHQSTNAPFAGYLGLKNFELLSCSPELFFTFAKNAQGENCIITKPIKGTRPRGQNVATDQDNKNELASSEKDIAENVMIVDLLRNDLGKYAKTGTVKVPKLFDIESFSNVHHMVSTITATLKDDISPWRVLFESLPAGSITGTPKKRAVEIINELEAKPRGAYCGTMGYLNFDGTGQWNVLIRTLQASDNNVSLWAGGGITIASDCDAEYQECFDKVGNLLKILHQ
ncbi:anthranilate synthase component I family protein [Moraxella osloensis]|uniref:Chorismate-binding protein n=1 Tax=Faucicola osloensis TaxID=34062 RepID=A0AAD0AFB0_FAUOS|nr:anthranilate synthase component I family protein [Moraxella osloensis]ATQ84119.1 chorismate-binding protein [Moraxella osloensis]ATW86606.1 anthranilate synthase component I family protein [Moraxella osloensis]